MCHGSPPCRSCGQLHVCIARVRSHACAESISLITADPKKMRRNCGRQARAPELSARLPSPTSKPSPPSPASCALIGHHFSRVERASESAASDAVVRHGARIASGAGRPADVEMKQALPHAVPEALWGGPSGHMSVANTGRVTFARPCPTRGRFRIQIILLPKGRGRPHDHPASPHRPFVATAQLVRR